MAVKITQAKLNKIKKELKSETTDDILTTLSMVQALKGILQQELDCRRNTKGVDSFA